MSHPDRKKVRAMSKMAKKIKRMNQNNQLDNLEAAYLVGQAKKLGIDDKTSNCIKNELAKKEPKHFGGYDPSDFIRNVKIKVYQGGSCSPK